MLPSPPYVSCWTKGHHFIVIQFVSKSGKKKKKKKKKNSIFNLEHSFIVGEREVVRCTHKFQVCRSRNQNSSGKMTPRKTRKSFMFHVSCKTIGNGLN